MCLLSSSVSSKVFCLYLVDAQNPGINESHWVHVGSIVLSTIVQYSIDTLGPKIMPIQQPNLHRETPLV